MGIDLLVCSECETGFPDVSDYMDCECGRDWCDEECAKKGGLKQVLDEDGCFGGISDCKYCREEDFDDILLLRHAQELLGVSREQLIKSYKGKSN